MTGNLSDDYDDDGPDIGYCGRCGADMSGEPPAELVCGECAAIDMTAEGCPTCSWPIRETVGMVCQTCGTYYSTQAVAPIKAAGYNGPYDQRFGWTMLSAADAARIERGERS